MKTIIDIDNETHPLEKNTVLHLFLVAILALLIVAIIFLSWVPPVSRDALSHHLAVPKLYLQHGGITELPSVLFSYYPMNLDLLYVIPLYFGNDIAAKLIHFTFALLTAWLIYGYLEKRLSAVWAIFGAIFFLSLPIIVKLSITVYVDLGLVFFSTAALLSLLKWIENRFQAKFLVGSAICCGLALGTKYNGLIVLLILTLITPFVYISCSKIKLKKKGLTDQVSLNRIQLKALGFGVIFIFIALLVFSPWMIRNYVWTANPIYPLYDHLFNRQEPISPDSQTDHILESAAGSQQVPKARSTSWGSFAMRRVIYGESWWEVALIPVRIFFQGRDNSPKHFDGKLSPFLLVLSIFAIFQKSGNSAIIRTEKRIFAVFAIFFILYTFCTTSIRIRYIAAIIPPLIILSMFGFYNIASACRNRWQHLPYGFSNVCIFLLGIALLSYNALYIVQQFNYVRPFSYISGQESRDAYIVKYRPEYSIYQYANRNLPDRSKILGLFLGNRRYYSERELIFGVDAFRETVRQSDSAEILLMNLKKNGYTHVLIRFDLFNRWADRQFSESKKELLKAIFKTHLEPILAKNGYGLFELKKI